MTKLQQGNRVTITSKEWEEEGVVVDLRPRVQRKVIDVRGKVLSTNPSDRIKIRFEGVRFFDPNRVEHLPVVVDGESYDAYLPGDGHIYLRQ